MQKWKRDTLAAVLLIIFSIFGFIYSGTMTTDLIEITVAKPDVYLRLWFSALFILSVIMLITALRRKDMQELPKLWSSIKLATVILFALYLLVIPYIGFVIASLAALMIITTIYNFYKMGEIPKGKALVKHLGIYAVFTVICTMATYCVFRYVLSVNLPSWSLW